MGKASGRNRQNFGGLVGERAMSLFRNFASGLRSLFRKNQVDRELDEELGAYLEMEAAEKMRQGVSRKDALREVRLERGTLEITKELVRSAGWEFFVETCWRDLHYSVRMLRKSPGFAAVAIVTLALGIGANTAIFSLTDQILLRDLPVPHPEQLFILRSPGPNHGHTWGDVDQGAQSFSYPMYKDLRERATVFSGLLACRRLTVNGVPLTVVGVARKGFYGVQIGLTPDLFIPVTMKAQMAPNPNQTLEDRTDRWLPVVGRLKPGMTVARAEAELQPIYQPILESDAKLLKLSGEDLKRFISKPLLLISGAHGRLVLQEGAQEPLLVLMSMVGLVLLIACANLAGLLVARGEARQREIGV